MEFCYKWNDFTMYMYRHCFTLNEKQEFKIILCLFPFVKCFVIYSLFDGHIVHCYNCMCIMKTILMLLCLMLLCFSNNMYVHVNIKQIWIKLRRHLILISNTILNKYKNLTKALTAWCHAWHYNATQTNSRYL